MLDTAERILQTSHGRHGAGSYQATGYLPTIIISVNHTLDYSPTLHYASKLREP